MQQHRDVLRESRKRGNFRTAAIVGYTNAGKSTLLNVLTGSEVLEEDALFATLDPTTRLLELPRGGEILLTDTVGFIRKLPHHLIEAFKSTLEEAVLADVIVHVVDASNEQMEQQMYVVYETLRELGAEGKPVVTLFNKQDKLQEERVCKELKADYSLRISAKTGQGLEKFRETLEEILLAAQIYIERVYSYTEAGKIALIRQKGQLISEEYLPEGIQVKAYVPREIYGNV